MSNSTSEIITIGKRKWLVGMAWHSFEDVPHKSELADDAERLNASWVCVRKGASAIQAGFCQPIPGVKKLARVYSLAAMLADSREQPWLGVFKIAEDKYWLVAIRDKHAIMPSTFPSDGDFVGTEDEVKRLRDSHAGMAEWTHISGDLDDLAKWIEEIDERPTPVRPLQGGLLPSTAGLLGMVALLAAVAAGAYWWQEKRAEEDRLIAERRAALKARIEAGQTPVVLPSPLLTSPPPGEWLGACREIIHDLPLSHMGWLLTHVSCLSQKVTVTWERKAGATVAHRPDGQVQDSGDVIEQEIPLPSLRAADQDNSVDLNEARLRLRAWAQAADFNLTFTSIDHSKSPEALPGSEASAHPGPADSPTAAFSITLLVSPFDLDFSQIPGLRLTSIKTTESGWLLEGVLHGRAL